MKINDISSMEFIICNVELVKVELIACLISLNRLTDYQTDLAIIIITKLFYDVVTKYQAKEAYLILNLLTSKIKFNKYSNTSRSDLLLELFPAQLNRDDTLSGKILLKRFQDINHANKYNVYKVVSTIFNVLSEIEKVVTPNATVMVTINKILDDAYFGSK